MQARPHPPAFPEYVRQAATALQAQGWFVVRCVTDPDASWHIAARKGAKWRIIQLARPAAAPSVRQRQRMALGEAVRLPARLGTMEQWLPHVRPDGHVTFGPYALQGQHWAEADNDALGALGRLGLDA